MTTFGRTFGPAFGRTLGSIFEDIQNGGGGGVSLIFLASYYDGDDYAQLLVSGKGTSTVAHTASVYSPDYLGLQREFKDGETVWRGGRVIFDPDQLVLSFTASADTPQPLTSLICYLNDGSTASYHCGDQMLRDVASGVNAGPDVVVSEGDSVNVYAGNLTSLTDLFLYSNQLTGSIPAEIGNLTSLEYLYITTNQLTGSIPPEIGNLTSLEYLYLYSNQLAGSIPTEIGNLTSLVYLFLDTNQLTGSIPAEIGNLTSVIRLYLNTNQLTGSIPAEIGNLTSVIRLYLYSNQLTGSIPAEIGNLTSLTRLYLDTNQLTGSIPTEIGNLTSLTLLYLNTNQLTDYAGGATFAFVNTLNFNASDNLLTESAVNNLFINFDNGTLGAASTINIGGTGNAPPTGAGLDAANSLIAKGHNVTHN